MKAVSIVVLALAAVAACSGPERRVDGRPRAREIDAGAPPVREEVVPEPRGPIVPEDDRAPDGAACTRSDECGPGQQCRGAPGCHSGWACGEARECMTESVAYCDCDGSTFYAPGGCAGRPYAHVGPCEDVGEIVASGTELGVPDWDEPPTEDERACADSAECGRGRLCWGVAGCATTWSCVRARGCTRDSVPFCGCDGQTFRASSTCPGRPFVHRGECRTGIASAGIDAGVAGPIASAPRDAGIDARVAIAAGPGPDAGRAIAASAPDAGRAVVAASTPPDAGTIVASATSAPDAGEVMSMPAGPRGCRSNRDCRRGQVCQGPPGCGGDVEWVCGPPERECIRDTQVFCDCEGEDFRASMFCPARPYRHRGSCEIDRMMELSGAAPR